MFFQRGEIPPPCRWTPMPDTSRRPRQRRLPQDDIAPAYFFERRRYAGALLQAKRRSLEYSIEDIGRLIGLAPSKVSAIEKPQDPQDCPPGHRPYIPNIETIDRFAHVVSLTWKDLFPPDPHSPAAQLQRLLARWTPAQIAGALELLASFERRTRKAPPRRCPPQV